MLAEGLPDLDGVMALSAETCAALRDACLAAGYGGPTLDRIGIVPRGPQGPAVPLLRRALLRATGGEGGNHTRAAGLLALLFACEDLVPEALLREAVGDALSEALLESGFVFRKSGGDLLSSNFQLLPFDGLYILGDQLTRGAAAVMPPGPTTVELLGVVSEHVQGRVLDLGCGPGSLALATAHRGAEWAVGSDINPRAIQMAEFNARLNQVPNVTFVVGDLAEPVRGQHFDLVIAQPPFMVQPPDTTAIVFLHGGPTGESITLRMVAALPELLAPGGRALILTEAPARPSEPTHQRFREQLGDVPIDVVVLGMPAGAPGHQAMRYAMLEAPEGSEDYTAALERYAEHLENLDLQVLAHVLIVARARDPESEDADSRFSATIPIPRLSVGDGDAIDALFAALDLTSVDDETLGATKLRSSPFARWVLTRRKPDLTEEPDYAVEFDEGRFARDVDNLSARAFRLTGLVDRAESVDQAADQHASANGLEPTEAHAQMLRFVREALGRGLLER
jgi:SAM-dependent methyltransferase